MSPTLRKPSLSVGSGGMFLYITRGLLSPQDIKISPISPVGSSWPSSSRIATRPQCILPTLPGWRSHSSPRMDVMPMHSVMAYIS